MACAAFEYPVTLPTSVATNLSEVTLYITPESPLVVVYAT